MDTDSNGHCWGGAGSAGDKSMGKKGNICYTSNNKELTFFKKSSSKFITVGISKLINDIETNA